LEITESLKEKISRHDSYRSIIFQGILKRLKIEALL
jgi:hypothetical protein